MTTYSIEGKFYPLQDGEFMKSRRELTTAQRDIFCHLKIRNPFGDCFTRTNIREIAERLELSRRTVSDALKVLNRLGWIKLELVTAEILVCPRTSNKSSDEGGSENTRGSKFPCVENAPQEVENENTWGSKFPCVDSKNTYGSKFPCVENAPQEVENAPQEVENAPQEGQLEALSGIGFKIPQTKKTNKISLLEDKSEEREKFLKFAMKKVDELPKRPQLPKKWINKNHDELWAEYEELERRRKESEERIGKSIEKQQETVLDPIIAAGLASGKILKLDPLFKGLWDAQNNWHHQSEWIEAEKQRLAES